MVTFQGNINITGKYALELCFLKQNKVVQTCNFSVSWEVEARKIVIWRLKQVM